VQVIVIRGPNLWILIHHNDPLLAYMGPVLSNYQC